MTATIADAMLPFRQVKTDTPNQRRAMLQGMLNVGIHLSKIHHPNGLVYAQAYYDDGAVHFRSQHLSGFSVIATVIEVGDEYVVRIQTIPTLSLGG